MATLDLTIAFKAAIVYVLMSITLIMALSGYQDKNHLDKFWNNFTYLVMLFLEWNFKTLVSAVAITILYAIAALVSVRLGF